jgi:hypothetical protein
MVLPGKARHPAMPDTVDHVKGTFARWMLLGPLAVAVFGGKVGGVIAMVPCYLLLLMAMAMAMAGIRITVRRVLVVLGSGVALFAVFALINYLVPATGRSDIGAFAGNLVHGHAGEPLRRMLGIALAMMWLVCVLGWFAGDSGIIVPATTLPLALPLGFALPAGVPLSGDGAAERGPSITGSTLVGRIG